MNLKISVDYYNATEVELFKSYPNYNDIEHVIGKQINVKEGDFVSYLMFTEQADDVGWRTHVDLKDRVQYRLGDIQDFLDFSKGSIQSKLPSTRMFTSGMTERIGVSLGINVINKIHGLTEADWAITNDTYIDGKRVKDFDYELPMASDGIRFIQVENKGTVNDNNTIKSSSVSKHFRSIKEKKNSILLRDEGAGLTRHQNIYYGTIGVLDSQNIAKVWLVDPPALNVEWDPRKFRLISRLIYYSKIFGEIGIHKKFQFALQVRIIELIMAKDIEEYNNKPLTSSTPLTYIGSKNLVKINGNEAFGTFFFLNNEIKKDVFMIALPKVIIKLVLYQRFDDILKYEYNNAELSERVSIELSAKLNDASEDFENTNTKFVLDEKRKKYFYQSYQKISSTSSGRIFGLINNG